MTADQSIDLDAIQAAAAAALAAPIDAAPAGVYEAHQCQTGCGRLATVILVRIADSDLDILCDVCYLLMAMAVANAIPDAPTSPDASQDANVSDGTAQSAPAPE